MDGASDFSKVTLIMTVVGGFMLQGSQVSRIERDSHSRTSATHCISHAEKLFLIYLICRSAQSKCLWPRLSHY